MAGRSRPPGGREIGVAIRRARLEGGLTQQEVVERLQTEGISLTQPALAKIEGGNRGVSADEIFAFARVLGVQVERLGGVSEAYYTHLISQVLAEMLYVSSEIAVLEKRVRGLTGNALGMIADDFSWFDTAVRAVSEAATPGSPPTLLARMLLWRMSEAISYDVKRLNNFRRDEGLPLLAEPPASGTIQDMVLAHWEVLKAEQGFDAYLETESAEFAAEEAANKVRATRRETG